MKKTIIFLFTLLITLGACNKDDQFMGTLVVEFDQPRIDMTIYPIENTSKGIFDVDLEDRTKYSVKMNIGNYYCVIGDYNFNYSGMGFQIRAGKTTKIVYKVAGGPKVIYK